MLEASMQNSTVGDIGVEKKTRGLRESWEKSSGLCGCCLPIQAKFPRCSAFFLRILLPLWALVCVALIGGWWLSDLEAPEEYDMNDVIVKARFQFDLSDSRKYEDQLIALPSTCFYGYLNDTNLSLETSSKNNSLSTVDMLIDLDIYLKECSKNATQLLDLNDDVQEQAYAYAIVPLSFNWIRCWDSEKYGKQNPFKPSSRQILAASNQTEFYEDMWRADQARLFEEYRNETKENTDCKGSACSNGVALNRSMAEATGRGGCDMNRAATAWFFFTVMTTVGYGNQAPATDGGRYLVIFLGFFSVLAFGAILASAGTIMSIIFEDFARRVQVKKRIYIGCLWWAMLTFLWVLFLASRVGTWWAERIIDMDDVPDKLWGSMWFAYISMTTIGLGDYFLQPEVFFFYDLFAFSWQFLVGFTFFSGFLAKLSELVLRGSRASFDLEDRLRKTNLFSSDPDIGGDSQSKTANSSDLIRMLEEQLQNQDENPDDPSLVAQEENLLEQLLEQRKTQRLRMQEESNNHQE